MKLMRGAMVVAVLCSLVLAPQMLSAQNPTEKDPDEVGSAAPTGQNCNAIPDDTYDGSIGSMACFTIAGPSGTVQNVDLQLGIDHTWVGDLTGKVMSPTGTVLTIFSRPGFAETGDDGSGCCGSSSDIVSTSPLSFADPLPNDPEMMGSAGLVVCQGDGICDYFANPDTGPGVDFAQFIGEDASGDWMVCLGDSAGGDTGFICDPVLTVTVAVPTTNRMGMALLLIALIGGSLLIMRRRATVG